MIDMIINFYGFLFGIVIFVVVCTPVMLIISLVMYVPVKFAIALINLKNEEESE
jgi:hypothetical protein